MQKHFQMTNGTKEILFLRLSINESIGRRTTQVQEPSFKIFEERNFYTR